MRIPLVGTQGNRGYLNLKDFLSLNMFVEKSKAINCPGWFRKKVMSLTKPRASMFCASHSLFYLVIGDALYSLSADLQTLTEIARKTPTSVAWSAPAGGTFTFIFAAAHGFIATQRVKTSGITPASYSNVFTVNAVSTTSVANDTFTVIGVGADPGVATLTTPRVSPIVTETGKCYFQEAKNGSAQVVMLQVPKSSEASQQFMIAAAGVVTKVTDLDYPTNCVGAIVTIDSYVFSLAEDTALAQHRVHNCVLEAPLSHNGLDYKSAESHPDAGITLARHHNQLVVFKEYSTEFFYNANNLTGSPLDRIPQQTKDIGCASASSVAQIGDKIAFLSRNQNGGLGVHLVIGGQLQKVSTVFIDKILASVESIVFSGDVDGFYISYQGHDLYFLSFEGVQGSNQAIAGIAIAGVGITGLGSGLSTFRRTIVYDITEGLWHEQSTVNQQTGQESVFFGGFPISGPHVSTTQNYSNTLIMDKENADIYEMSPAPVGSSSPATYTHGTKPVTKTIITENIKFGINAKIGKLEVLGDRQDDACVVSISWSDDDYKTWSAARTVDLQNRAFINRLGMTRSGYRAFKLTSTASAPVRLEELQIEVEA